MAEAVHNTGPQSTVVRTEELPHIQMGAPSSHHTRHHFTMTQPQPSTTLQRPLRR
jgi:hypothetical protein